MSRRLHAAYGNHVSVVNEGIGGDTAGIPTVLPLRQVLPQRSSVFFPEGQPDSIQARSAWDNEENSPVPAGRLNRSWLRSHS